MRNLGLAQWQLRMTSDPITTESLIMQCGTLSISYAPHLQRRYPQRNYTNLVISRSKDNSLATWREFVSVKGGEERFGSCRTICTFWVLKYDHRGFEGINARNARVITRIIPLQEPTIYTWRCIYAIEQPSPSNIQISTFMIYSFK